MSKEQKNMKWPDGYCLDPNGKMVPPAGKDEDYNFGYEMGFLDAWEIMNNAIRAAHNNRIDEQRHTIRCGRLYLDWQYGKDAWGESSGDKYVISYFQVAKVIRDNGQCIRRVVLWRLHIAWGFVT